MMGMMETQNVQIARIASKSDSSSLKSLIQLSLQNSATCTEVLASSPKINLVIKAHLNAKHLLSQDGRLIHTSSGTASFEPPQSEISLETLKLTESLTLASKAVFGAIQVKGITLSTLSRMGTSQPARFSSLVTIDWRSQSRMLASETTVPVIVPVILSLTDQGEFSNCASTNSAVASTTRSTATIVRHGMRDTAPGCPSGWKEEYDGYSYAGTLHSHSMPTNGGGATGRQVSAGSSVSLDKVESCRKSFTPEGIGHVMSQYSVGGEILRSVNYGAWGQTTVSGSSPFIYSVWLASQSVARSSAATTKDFSKQLIGRCSVCSKQNTDVSIVHGNSTETPSCASSEETLWIGYTFNSGAVGIAQGTGTCMERTQWVAHVFCHPSPLIGAIAACGSTMALSMENISTHYDFASAPTASSYGSSNEHLLKAQVRKCAVCATPGFN